jgi:hypothetical protein
MDRDELPQVAALDFAFVQHVVPRCQPRGSAGAMVDLMAALSALGKHFDAKS